MASESEVQGLKHGSRKKLEDGMDLNRPSDNGGSVASHCICMYPLVN